MATKKDFAGAMNKMAGREFVLPGERKGGSVKPFGEGVRDELEKQAETLPIGEVYLVELQNNPFQYLARPEVDEEAMGELVSSIEKNGFFGALLARRKKGVLEQYELAFGHRRKEAALRAGLTKLPVKILDLTDAQMARIMASENFARQDLTPVGEANVVGLLSTTQNLSTAEVAKIVGRGEGWVNLRLSLYNAPKDIKTMVESKPETLSYIRLLTPVKDLAKRAELIEGIISGELTREKLEALLKSAKGTTKSNQTLLETTDSVEIDPNLTNSIPYRDSAEKHNQNTSQSDTYTVALHKLDKAISQFEIFLAQTELDPTKQEVTQLAELIDRLNKATSSTGKPRSRNLK